MEDSLSKNLTGPTYSSMRNDFYDKIGTKFPKFKHLQLTEFIVASMNCSDYVVNKEMVKFISSSFGLRNNLLPNNII